MESQKVNNNDNGDNNSILLNVDTDIQLPFNSNTGLQVNNLSTLGEKFFKEVSHFFI